MSEKWRIDELQQITAKALQAIVVEGDLSGRVRAVPDARTIRYYTTIGLIDRPAEMQGRVAFYGRRQFQQLVCIKRSQFDGLSLNEIQQKLIGATNQKLARIADLPNGFWQQDSLAVEISTEDLATAEPIAKSSRPMDRESFWAASVEPAVEMQVSTSAPILCMRLPISPSVSLEVIGVDPSRWTPEVRESLKPVILELARTMERLGLVSPSSNPASLPKTSSTSRTIEKEHEL